MLQGHLCCLMTWCRRLILLCHSRGEWRCASKTTFLFHWSILCYLHGMVQTCNIHDLPYIGNISRTDRVFSKLWWDHMMGPGLVKSAYWCQTSRTHGAQFCMVHLILHGAMLLLQAPLLRQYLHTRTSLWQVFQFPRPTGRHWQIWVFRSCR